MTYIDQVGQQALGVFAEMWPAVLTGEYMGEPQLALHVSDGKLNHIKKHFFSGRLAKPEADRAQKAAGLIADTLGNILPQVLVAGFFGTATLSLTVVSGYPASCKCSIEQIHKPALAG